MDKLLKRCKELANIFKKGFQIDFGNSQKKIKSINDSIKNIGKTLKEIFTDPTVVESANHLLDSLALCFGKMVGSFARIGLTIADNLIGGFDKYLTGSKDYIKEKLASIFDIRAEIADLEGDFYVAMADIFDVFSGETAKSITGHIIGIFADGVLGACEVLLKFTRDIEQIFILPVTQNVDKIKTAIENTLVPIEIVLNTLHQAVVDTFEKISETYDQYVKPFMDSLAQGISDIVGTFLDAYNTYIVPVLDYLADKFSTVWAEHIQPALNGVIELIRKIFENLQALWETLLVPVINWIIATILPILGPIIANIGDQIFDLLAVAGDVIKGITDILGGFIDFCTGAFTGDFDKCWQGIEEIIEGFKTIAESIFKYVKEHIFQPFIDFIKGVFEGSWAGSFKTLKTILNTFGKSVSRIWSDIKQIFNGIIDFVTGVFTGNWTQAWEGIKNIFGGIFDGLITLAKTPLNVVIDIINSLMEKLNSGLSAIENAFSFSYDFKNPFTGSRHYGHYGLSLPRVPTIPPLAEGGFVKKNTPQLAMIGDNLHQGEIVSPENKLREMAIEAARAASGNGITRDEFERIINNAVMRIVAALSEMGFYLDSTQIAKASKTAQEIIDIRYNTVGVG